MSEQQDEQDRAAQRRQRHAAAQRAWVAKHREEHNATRRVYMRDYFRTHPRFYHRTETLDAAAQERRRQKQRTYMREYRQRKRQEG